MKIEEITKWVIWNKNTGEVWESWKSKKMLFETRGAATLAYNEAHANGWKQVPDKARLSLGKQETWVHRKVKLEFVDE